MANFATIYDGKVTNIIVGDSLASIESLLPDAIVIEIKADNPAAIGYSFNNVDGMFYIDTEFTKPYGYVKPKSNSELYSDALASLSAQYQSDTASLSSAYGLASLTDGSTQVPKQSALQAQFATLKTQFASNLAAIKLQYGV